MVGPEPTNDKREAGVGSEDVRFGRLWLVHLEQSATLTRAAVRNNCAPLLLHSGEGGGDHLIIYTGL